MTRSELQRLIAVVAEEVLAVVGEAGRAPTCECHAVLLACCPRTVNPVVEAGASRLGLHATGGRVGDVASLIDHTLLRPEATRADIERLCHEAAEFGFATVCVNPTWVSTASRVLRRTGVGVCSVVGFPLGATTGDVKRYEAQRAIFDGATEVDMVVNVGALKSGEVDVVERDIAAVVDVAASGEVISKVIIEAALLERDEKITVCQIAKAVGADFVKTSTGFGPGGATVEDVTLMREVVGERMGIKAAGGVRSFEGTRAMVEAGATRIGASAGIRIVQEARSATASNAGR